MRRSVVPVASRLRGRASGIPCSRAPWFIENCDTVVDDFGEVQVVGDLAPSQRVVGRGDGLPWAGVALINDVQADVRGSVMLSGTPP